MTNGVRLMGGSEHIDLMEGQTTIDSQPATKQEIFDYCKSYFKQGGGDGTGVTGLTLGETISTAYRGDRGKVAYDHTNRTDNPHGVVAADVGLSKVDNTSDLEKPVSNATQIKLDSKQELSEKGQAGGYAPLGLDGLVPIDYLNVSGLNFKGAWNAETNTPTLLDGEGGVGDFYKTSIAGTYNFGNGSYTFAEGDWVIFAAGVWQRLGSSDSVAMVNGKVGAVTVNKSDIGLSNVNNTSDLDKPISTLTQNSLNEKQDKLTSGTNIKTLNGQTILGSGDLAIISDSIINTSLANNVRTNEYSDRFEYLAKFSINASVSGSGYSTNQTSVYFPTGKTIDGANEHYISIRNNERTVGVNIFDNTSTGRVSVGYRNSWTETTNVQGTCFIKLVYYK